MKAIRPIVPVIASAGGPEILVYAMIDTAATSSAILLETLDAIGAPISQKSCKLSTFDQCTEAQRDFADFKVSPLDKSFEIEVNDALVGQILTTERDIPPSNSTIATLDYMDDVRFQELSDLTIGIILDASFAWTWVGGETRFRTKNEFGWTTMGTSPDETDSPDPEIDICLLDSEEQSLQEQINLMFRHDFIMSGHEVFSPEQIHPSAKDQFALKQLEESIKMNHTGHYKVALRSRHLITWIHMPTRSLD